MGGRSVRAARHMTERHAKGAHGHGRQQEGAQDAAARQQQAKTGDDFAGSSNQQEARAKADRVKMWTITPAPLSLA